MPRGGEGSPSPHMEWIGSRRRDGWEANEMVGIA